MGSDMHMDPPKMTRDVTWEGDEIVVRSRWSYESKESAQEIWRGKEDELERVRNLISVKIPPKPNSPEDFTIKNKTTLASVHTYAYLAAAKLMHDTKSIPTEQDLRNLIDRMGDKYYEELLKAIYP